jgi:hypothetical protein
MRKISIRILIAILIGFWFASVGTHIVYSPCLPSDNPGVPYNAPPNEDSLTRCAEFAKAIYKPRDLIHNKQDSLVHFSENFVGASVVCFALISLYNEIKMKRRAKA